MGAFRYSCGPPPFALTPYGGIPSRVGYPANALTSGRAPCTGLTIDVGYGQT